MSVRAGEVHRLVPVGPPHPVVLAFAFADHLEHLAAATCRGERGGLDDDLVATVGVHRSSSAVPLPMAAQRPAVARRNRATASSTSALATSSRWWARSDKARAAASSSPI